ncbi:GTP cyclohydrolase 1-like [Typha latifolia]|uniref:GTP cyclohydrolase 1-like n=1 Tax=Typha latifolia TaxID=4733 RepID=UPI003C30A940
MGAALEEEMEEEGELEAEAESTRAIEEAVKVLLQGLGEDHEREGLRRTPQRVAKAFREGTSGYRQKAKDIVQGALFTEAGLKDGQGYAGGAGGLVIVRDINLFSFCESCLLPFRVQCHIGYVPSGQRVVGLSKLSRVTDVFAKRLQDPKRLADEVCSALHSSIKPAGVAVALQCWHIQLPDALRCNPDAMSQSKWDMQGWARASFSSCAGVFEDGNISSFWDDFLTLLNLRDTYFEKGNAHLSVAHSWCPARSPALSLCNGHSRRNFTNGRISSKSGSTYPAMVSAAASVLQSLGEDPLRAELVGTPYRYVQWLMNFKTSNLQMKLSDLNVGKVKLQANDSGEVAIGRSGIYSELSLPFCSLCEHHLLPFHGVVHIGYFYEEEGEGIERAVLQSLVHFYSCKLQVQERFTRQIAEAVYSIFSRGVMVVIEAAHMCMISRGIKKVGSSTVTIAVMGQFSTDPAAKSLFLEAISTGTASGR